jgi:hypothetical protein
LRSVAVQISFTRPFAGFDGRYQPIPFARTRISPSSPKKRGRLLALFHDLRQEQSIQTFDVLAKSDIYVPCEFPMASLLMPALRRCVRRPFTPGYRKFSIRSNTELALLIDFVPATIEERIASIHCISTRSKRSRPHASWPNQNE